MNSLIGRFGLVAAALSGVVLAGCNAVEDVREAPYTAIPDETVVLQGTIIGLGSKRSIVLSNNDDNLGALSFLAAVPVTPSTGATVTPFSFGAVKKGSPYSIKVKSNPAGKDCTVAGGSGTITTAEALNITVTCVDIQSGRYDLTVTVASAFASAPGAKVTLTTEEAVYEKAVVSGQSTVVFPKVLFNPGSAGVPVFTWAVTASTFENNTLNKCIVQNATNPSVAGVAQNPTGDPGVSTAIPTVGRTAGSTAGLSPCLFTISGNVVYSAPYTGTSGAAETTPPPAMGAGGVTLELRDVQGKVLDTNTAPGSVTVNSYSTTGAANSFTLTTTAKSNSSGVYDVVVKSHPAGQRCIVGNGGTANLFVTGTTNPTNIAPASISTPPPNGTITNTGIVVYCRAVPTTTNKLEGTYRFTNRVLTNRIQDIGTPAPAPVLLAPTTSTWLPFDFTVQNTASSNMLTFFDDGTFLYGSHSSATQLEHGFYEYVPAVTGPPAVGAKIRFTIVTDTNAGNTAETNGLSFMPGRGTSTVTAMLAGSPGVAVPITVSLNHRVMTNVVRTTLPNGLHRITGTFGGATLDSNVSNPVPVAPPTVTLSATQASNGTWTLAWTSANATACSVPSLPQVPGWSGSKTPVAAGNTPSITVTTTTAFTLTCTNAALSSSTSVLVTVPGTTPVALPAAIQAAPASVPYQLDWQLTEPQSLNGEMTGTWITQDHRRAYVWDFATYYGHHVGVTGGAATVQDACFTMDNLHVSSGQYTRRGSVTGCYPWNRPFTNQFYLITTAEAVDFQSPAGLPGFIGRIPGGATALDGRSPSPLYFQVAPAASFAGTASATYFPTPPATGYSAATPFNSGTFGSWCTTEILGLRATLNNVPIDYPVYFCRTRAN